MSDTQSPDYRTLKLDGIYQQNTNGDLMLRLKLPGGLLSALQAEVICDLSDSYSTGILHLTCRGSLELHGLRGESLSPVFRRLQTVGLTTRGACGGAVRSIACAPSEGERYTRIQALVRRLHQHFSGNPHFEGLPKKFKIGIEDGYQGARHLAQDLAMVYLDREDGRDLCDVWVAGGLGAQPREGFLLAGRVPFERLLPLIEGVVKVYLHHAPPGKRLKHLLADIGEREFRALLARETRGSQPCPIIGPLDEVLDASTAPGAGGWIELPVFAGQLPSADLRQVAGLVQRLGDGFLAISPEQNLLISLAADLDPRPLKQALQAAGWPLDDQALNCRACPGSHACPKGLVPTRDVARQLDKILGEQGRSLDWAVAGCPNSCSQPQLADYGIIGVRKGSAAKEALFDLYHRDEDGFGKPLQRKLTLAELMQAIKALG